MGNLFLGCCFLQETFLYWSWLDKTSMVNATLKGKSNSLKFMHCQDFEIIFTRRIEEIRNKKSVFDYLVFPLWVSFEYSEYSLKWHMPHGGVVSVFLWVGDCTVHKKRCAFSDYNRYLFSSFILSSFVSVVILSLMFFFVKKSLIERPCNFYLIHNDILPSHVFYLSAFRVGYHTHDEKLTQGRCKLHTGSIKGNEKRVAVLLRINCF